MKHSFTFFNRFITIIGILLFSSAGQAGAQTAPEIGIHRNKPNVVALQNATIVVAPGKTLEGATLVVRNGIIEAVGRDVRVPADAVVHDYSGRRIYAGFIDLVSDYGMPKAAPGAASRSGSPSAAKRGTRSWSTANLADANAADLLATDEKMAKSLRGIGFTAVLSFPARGIFRGTGALVSLGDGDVNEMILAPGLAQGMSFSKGFRARTYPASALGVIAHMRQTFIDAEWYGRAHAAWAASPAGQDAPDFDPALEALLPNLSGKSPIIMQASNELFVMRAMRIAKEFELNMWYLDSGTLYRRLSAIENKKSKIIVALNFPEAPDVSSLTAESDVNLRTLRHWDFAPENPARVSKAGLPMALTAATLKKKGSFLKNLRLAVARGLSEDAALAALTTTPAAWLGMSSTLGSLEKGKAAHFIVTDGNLFDKKTKLLDTWVAGKKYRVTRVPHVDVRGTYDVTVNSATTSHQGELVISGPSPKPMASFTINNRKIKAKTTVVEGGQIAVSFPVDSLGGKGLARLSGLHKGTLVSGRGSWGDGTALTWEARLSAPFVKKKAVKKEKPVAMASFEVVYPDGAFGRAAVPEQPAAVLVKNATIWTSGDAGILQNSDMLIKAGKIAAIGKNINAPSGAVTIDAHGKHITPGMIDAHSHIAADGINEGTHSITSEVRIGDVINGDDITIYRQLTGGLTMSNILHGSANAIGGQNAVIKLRWGSPPEVMKYENAMPGIKFALGENVKRSRSRNNTRYPNTRMGVEQFIRDKFQAAKDYRQKWQAYNRAGAKSKGIVPPRRNLRYEALLEILDGTRQIHCHSYRQDEILALIRVADEMGFKVDVFTHILEGYKVADDMKKHGSMASTFSDWWAYKMEVYDAIPFNGQIMHDVGLVVSFNSDNGELARRMNTEAAKAVRYGGVDQAEAFKFVTLNPAKQLHVEKYVGSLEVGKEADFAIWNGSPLSTLTRCEQTWVDGRKYFDYDEDKKMQQDVAQQRNTLIQKIFDQKKSDKPGKGKKSSPGASSVATPRF